MHNDGTKSKKLKIENGNFGNWFMGTLINNEGREERHSQWKARNVILPLLFCRLYEVYRMIFLATILEGLITRLVHGLSDPPSPTSSTCKNYIFRLNFFGPIIKWAKLES